MGTSYAAGEALAPAGSTALIEVLEPDTRTDYNVIAETPTGRADNVVMPGAHLDGVTTGPGINDNGSGSRRLLETAAAMAGPPPNNTVRFAWWGAEEDGLFGSSTTSTSSPSGARRSPST